jgi:hypothetical protein
MLFTLLHLFGCHIFAIFERGFVGARLEDDGCTVRQQSLRSAVADDPIMYRVSTVAAFVTLIACRLIVGGGGGGARGR